MWQTMRLAKRPTVQGKVPHFQNVRFWKHGNLCFFLTTLLKKFLYPVCHGFIVIQLWMFQLTIVLNLFSQISGFCHD
jgi:hypothetical protein